MAREAVALIVGVSQPATIHYGGTDYDFGPITVSNDVAWYSSVVHNGFDGHDVDVRVLLTPDETTVARITQTVDELRTALAPDGLFVLIVCGHGFQAPRPAGSPPSRCGNNEAVDATDDLEDEIFAASDGAIVDDFWACTWALFPATTRIVTIADTCSADTILLGVNPIEPRAAELDVEADATRAGPVRAMLAASKTWQKETEQAHNEVTHGRLTYGLIQAWPAATSYDSWFRGAAAGYNEAQLEPRLRLLGATDALMAQMPFVP